MHSTNNQPVWILCTKQEARYFKKISISVPRKKFLVIAFDRIVSAQLTQDGIHHLCADTILTEHIRREILTSSNQQLVRSYNVLTQQLEQEHTPQLLGDFFDAVKYQKFSEFATILYYYTSIQILVATLRPKQVAFFTPLSLVTILLKDICAQSSIDTYAASLPVVHQLKTVCDTKLPFLTKQRGVRDRIYTYAKNMFSSAPIKHTGTRVLLTPCDNQKTFTNVIQGLHSFKIEPAMLYEPLHPSLHWNSREAIERYPHLCTYTMRGTPPSSQQKSLRLHESPEMFNSWIETLFSVLPKKTLPSIIQHTRHFGLWNWYHYFIDIRNKFEHEMARIQPSIFFGDNFYDMVTRTGIACAHRHMIKSYAVTKLHEELFSSPYPPQNILDKYIPYAVGVHTQTAAQKVSMHTLVTNTLQAPITTLLEHLTNIDKYKVSHHKNNGITILFTSQQHLYTFDYIRIVAQAIKTLSTRYPTTQVTMLVRPHPVEYTFWYTYTLRRYKRLGIKVDKSKSLGEVLAHADVIITSHSFTAFEALEQQKKVILLSFSRLAVEPDILLYRPTEFFHPLCTEVHTPEELVNTLRSLIQKQQ